MVTEQPYKGDMHSLKCRTFVAELDHQGLCAQGAISLLTGVQF
jgi:hypothetical protein